MRLDTQALRTLCAIADHGGITRAAEHLALSQSAVSHKIKRLEDSIGCALLTRQTGGPLLSEDGERLLTYARRMCALHDEAVRSLGKQPLAGRIRLGMTEDVTSSDLAQFLGRFTRLHPDVSVRTRVRQSLLLQQDLENGALDIALMQIFSRGRRASDRVLFSDTLHWVKARDLDIGMGRATPFLAYDKDCFYKDWAMDPGHHPAAGLETVLECASSAGIASAVRSGLGVALLPGRYLSPDMQILTDGFAAPPGLDYILRTNPGSNSAPVRSLAGEITAGLERHNSLHAV